MQRRAFLENISGPVVAVCAVCLGACSKSADNAVVPQNVNFTLDLSNSLTGIGASLVQSGVIVVRLSAGNTPSSFTAVQVACTHEGTSINFNLVGNKFICPNHGATFSTTGVVTMGPANKSLKLYTIAINGNTMTVTG